jgi:uncharacterized phage protein (predicted DNA packaging)
VTLLDIVKKALRVSNDALDDAEIAPLIEAAKKELAIAGVVTLDETDPMIIRYCTVYAKAHFGYDNPEADRFERIADSIKGTLSQVGDYNGSGNETASAIKEIVAEAVGEYFENGVALDGGKA